MQFVAGLGSFVLPVILLAVGYGSRRWLWISKCWRRGGNRTRIPNDQGGAEGDLRLFGTQGVAAVVPEPASLGLIGAGLVILIMRAAKRNL